MAGVDATVDAGALHAKHRIDAPEPLQGNIVPGAAINVVVDGEEDRRTLPAAGRGMQLPCGASVFDTTGEPAGEVRRCCPAGLPILEITDDHQSGGGERLCIGPGDRLGSHG
ncbi:Uncharacterised protein [Mycobacteroides abscessus subsp. abscessus]|nr:Uncharacterised protein [Mycobacteroides abscessus subsp. abscessus]